MTCIDCIDFTSAKQINDLCKDFEKYKEPLVGHNEDGETVITQIHEDMIVSETFQSNGWTRKNIFYTDGSSEELYEKA